VLVEPGYDSVHLYLHVHFDQVLVRVEWCYLWWFLEVDYLGLAASHFL
jgi:hypothetical protein